MANRILIVWLLAVGLTSCGAAVIPLENGPQTPAAEGRITTGNGRNGNLQLAIEVRHLAHPERVSPGATTYAVWVQPAGGPPQNIGALRVDGDLTGRLETLTPLHEFDLFITTEADQTVAAPTGPRVLSAAVSR